MLLSLNDVGILFAILLINSAGILVAWRQYMSKGHLSPTIIAHLGFIFYGALPILFMIIAPERSKLVFGRYDLELTWRIGVMYTVASIGCLGATFFIPPIKIRKLRYSKSPHRMLRLCNLLYLTACIGAILIIWIYDRTWAQVGGIYGFIFSGESRMTMNQLVFSKSIYSFFNYYVLFKMFFSICLIALFLQKKFFNKISAMGYGAIAISSLFPLITLLGGTRLIVLHAIVLLTVSAALFIRIKINVKILIFVFIMFLSLNYIGNKRSIIRKSFSDRYIYTDQLLEDAIGLSLIPAESFTGYIPPYIIFASGEEKFIEPQFVKLIPRIVANFLNIEKKEHFSKLLGMYGKYARNMTVFTVPLPVDAYFGLWRSYILVGFYSFSIFIVFNLSSRLCIRLNSINGYYLYLVLMGLVWVYIRYDINRSFSRTWQTILFSIPIVILLYFIGSLNRNRVLLYAAKCK